MSESILKDNALYFTDNGAIRHGKCCGMTARFSGRDLSGQKVMEITPAVHKECVDSHGFTPRCELCGRSRVGQPQTRAPG